MSNELIVDEATATEGMLRDMIVPYFDTQEELDGYIKTLVERPHDYGTCVYAMSMAAVATFQFVAHKLGVTGFQASCADMDIVRRTRLLEDGFMLLNANDLLYPQYSIPRKVDQWIGETLPTLAAKAQKLLAEAATEGRPPSPAVEEHWRRIASLSAPEPPEAK